MTGILELVCSILATLWESTWPGFEESSPRQATSQKKLQMSCTGAGSPSPLRVKEEAS